MTRRSRWLWLGLIAILLLPLGGWLASQHVLAWAFALLTYQLPGKLSVDSLHGSLLGSIELGGLRYQAPELDFELQQASLDWRPLAHASHLGAAPSTRVLSSYRAGRGSGRHSVFFG